MICQEVTDGFCKLEADRLNECDKAKYGYCEFFEKKKFLSVWALSNFILEAGAGGIGKEFAKLDDTIDLAKSMELEDDDDGYELICGVVYVVDNMGNDLFYYDSHHDCAEVDGRALHFLPAAPHRKRRMGIQGLEIRNHAEGLSEHGGRRSHPEKCPRILPMGNFLRKTKINELPQLVNIFIGEMSVIGPRPQAKSHYDLYSDEVKSAIDSVPPGLSGLGSVVFRDEEDMLSAVAGDRDAFHDTVIAPYNGALEIWFVRHRSVGVYFKLIFLTMLAVLRPSSKAWRTAFKDLPPVPNELEDCI